jgi:hypothetical protein
VDVAEVRGDEVGADQEQDDRGAVQALIDLPTPLLAGNDPPVVPSVDVTLAFQKGELGIELLAPNVVLVAV